MGGTPEHVERGRGGDSIQGEGNGTVVGCAGWSSFRPRLLHGENWKNRFKSVLQAYSATFKFVEVNSSFYRLPRVQTAKRWREEVGEGFLFSMKAPRSITHEKKFHGTDEDVEKLLEVAGALKPFFVLFQLPKSFRFSPERLQLITDFVEGLPRSYRYGFELRGWDDNEVRLLLDRVDVTHVVDPFERESLRGRPYYFRLHGSPPGKTMYRYRYTEKDLRQLKEKVRGLEGEVYVVFNNIWMCENALRFLEMLKE